MGDVLRICFWKNFGAAIDMLKSAITLCPEELWRNEKRFFYLAYHTTIFLDYYLTQPVKKFQPQLSFTIIDASDLPVDAIDDVMPNEHFSRTEMLNYLSAIREKCRQLILSSTDEFLNGRWIAEDEIDIHGLCPSLVVDYTVLEILFYNFRHIQHHVAQLNFILRQRTGKAPDWISHAG